MAESGAFVALAQKLLVPNATYALGLLADERELYQAVGSDREPVREILPGRNLCRQPSLAGVDLLSGDERDYKIYGRDFLRDDVSRESNP